ncbi:MAG: MarR family transcriptional regulator [Betaproteobacteria bacterium]|nr:MarR family transcriptional regulator [Betaproteobacteria bacterium]
MRSLELFNCLPLTLPNEEARAMATKSNQNQVDLFFHYQSLLHKATVSQGLEALSPDHLALLVLIGHHWHDGEAMSVRQLMQMRDVASPATIHKRLHQLKDADLVSFEESATDTRKRMICLLIHI